MAWYLVTTRGERQLLRCALLRYQRDLPPPRIDLDFDPTAESINQARTVVSDLVNRLDDIETPDLFKQRAAEEEADEHLPY